MTVDQFLILLLSASLLTRPQADTTKRGIQFESKLSWEQVLLKARTENKHIFVDAYATWCAPCKYMDTVTYSDQRVGEYANSRFVSIKVQMDTSKEDNERVKKWYRNAQVIVRDYRVTAYPTYLFFSPTGEVVHRDVGSKKAADFIAVLSEALEPDHQYYTLLRRYRDGEKNYRRMPYLAQAARRFGEKDLATTVAQDYINYLFIPGNEGKIYSKGNIEFISSFIQSTREKGFDLFYHRSDTVDQIIGQKGFSQKIADYAITKEYINPTVILATKGGPSPDWSSISNEIKAKFGSKYAERNILDAKIRWYRYKEDWAKYTGNIVARVQKYGPFGIGILDFDLNNHAWEVFLYSNDKAELRQALAWSDKAVRLNNDANKGNWMDTKANLLYKLGRRKEAIRIEEEAVKLDPQKKEIQETLEKMKKGEPTWRK